VDERALRFVYGVFSTGCGEAKSGERQVFAIGVRDADRSALDAQIRQGLEESDKLAAEVSDAGFRRKLSDLKRSL
jgi:hypothetical protein